MDPSPAAALKHAFAPVVGPRARLLVLGSLPGEASLARSEYYAHPQNQFWRLMARVIGRPIDALPYVERLAALVEARVALWDVVRSAERRGSLDAQIRAHTAQPLAEFVAALPDLRVVAFNGGAACRLGSPALAGRAGLDLVRLPSSSPAYAAIGFEAKAAAWERLRSGLEDG